MRYSLSVPLLLIACSGTTTLPLTPTADTGDEPTTPDPTTTEPTPTTPKKPAEPVFFDIRVMATQFDDAVERTLVVGDTDGTMLWDEPFTTSGQILEGVPEGGYVTLVDQDKYFVSIDSMMVVSDDDLVFYNFPQTFGTVTIQVSGPPPGKPQRIVQATSCYSWGLGFGFGDRDGRLALNCLDDASEAPGWAEAQDKNGDIYAISYGVAPVVGSAPDMTASIDLGPWDTNLAPETARYVHEGDPSGVSLSVRPLWKGLPFGSRREWMKVDDGSELRATATASPAFHDQVAVVVQQQNEGENQWLEVRHTLDGVTAPGDARTTTIEGTSVSLESHVLDAATGTATLSGLERFDCVGTPANAVRVSWDVVSGFYGYGWNLWVPATTEEVVRPEIPQDLRDAFLKDVRSAYLTAEIVTLPRGFEALQAGAHWRRTTEWLGGPDGSVGCRAGSAASWLRTE